GQEPSGSLLVTRCPCQLGAPGLHKPSLAPWLIYTNLLVTLPLLSPKLRTPLLSPPAAVTHPCPQGVELSSLQAFNFSMMETECAASARSDPEDCAFKENGVILKCLGTVKMLQESPEIDLNCSESSSDVSEGSRGHPWVGREGRVRPPAPRPLKTPKRDHPHRVPIPTVSLSPWWHYSHCILFPPNQQ
uniref:Uncharacterized protein n=1 Tax=Catharus ustulatus TaxID=91951 RepID=A0A8C3TT99_CATUS